MDCSNFKGDCAMSQRLTKIRMSSRWKLLRVGLSGAALTFACATLMALTWVGSALAPVAAATTIPSSNVALDWNEIAVNAIRVAQTSDGIPPGAAARPLYQTEGLLYTAYVQAAVYDATMKISHRYQPYHDFEVTATDASLDAAVIASAYNTLIFYLGDPSGALGTSYAAAIAALPDDETADRGIAVGRAAAAAIEELRANDGRNAPASGACA